MKAGDHVGFTYTYLTSEKSVIVFMVQYDTRNTLFTIFHIIHGKTISFYLSIVSEKLYHQILHATFLIHLK